MTSYLFALDAEVDVAHAFVDGQMVTLCERPMDGYRFQQSADGIGRSVAMCEDCRAAYGAC